jgi:hypothetical protein
MGMPPAFYEALFNNICQDGILNLASLARCSAVSQQWRGDLAKALPTLRDLDFGDYRERVTGADVMRTLTRVATGGYLRVVDLRGMLSVSNWSEDNIVDFIRVAMPYVTNILRDSFSLIVREQNGRRTPLTVPVRYPTCKIIKEAFCQARPGQGHNLESTIFLFDGSRFPMDSTTQQVGMAEGEVLDAMIFLGGPPSAGAYMEDHVVSSIPASGGTVTVDTTISVTFRRSAEPVALYPSRQEITLEAFLDAAAPCRVGYTSIFYRESSLSTTYQGRVPPWTDQVLGPKFHVVAMDLVEEVGDTLEYHHGRNNGGYYGGDEHSWQRYSNQMPLAGELAIDEATRTIRFTPAQRLLPGQRYLKPSTLNPEP